MYELMFWYKRGIAIRTRGNKKNVRSIAPTPPIIVRYIASNPYPSNKSLCPGSTLNAVSASGRPKKTLGTKLKIVWLMIFILSGILGLIMMNSFMLPSSFVLFPIFTGLFGMSHLLISLNIKTKIPKQKTHTRPIPRRLALSGIVKGLVSGSILGVLPGLGAAQATILTQQITRKRNTREFLISVGAINTIVAMFSLVALYTIMRPRSGAAVAVEKLIQNFGFNELLLLLGVAMIATGLSAILLLKTVRGMISLLERVNYRKLTLSIIMFLIILTIIFTGPLGLLVLGVSTAIGLLPPLFGTKRSLCMGSLMLPLIMFYSGIFI